MNRGMLLCDGMRRCAGDHHQVHEKPRDGDSNGGDGDGGDGDGGGGNGCEVCLR